MASGRAAPRCAPPFIDPPGYARHQPEQTLLHRIVEQHYPEFLAAREAAGRSLPKHVQQEFEAYLKCGRFEHGFLRVKCEQCQAEKLVAFSCKGRAICPSYGARRMTETAALLVDEVLPSQPMRQWVFSLPFALRFLLARDPQTLTHVLGIVYRVIAGHILKKAHLTQATGQTGAVTLIQRFGSALNLNVHLHMLFLNGAYLTGTNPPVFQRIDTFSARELQQILQRIVERIARALQRKGLLIRDSENSSLNLEPADTGPLSRADCTAGFPVNKSEEADADSASHDFTPTPHRRNISTHYNLICSNTRPPKRGRSRTNPEQSILAGAKYFAEVKEKVPGRLPEPDRTWLAVASYNVGFGHLEDARILAQSRGKNPDSWADVREHLPLLAQERYYSKARRGYARGWEPVQFVDRVQRFLTLLEWSPREAIARETRVEQQPEA